MRFPLTLATYLMGLAAVSAAEPPRICVPFSSVVVTLDGELREAEWADAAAVRDIRLLGGAGLASPATTFHLKHDGVALWVGVSCVESEPDYPNAHVRQPTDILTDDDAVQVVLGVADENVIVREVLNMGGYPGAMNQPVAAADHYYQFTVNAVGSTSRTYNESALERPLFAAAAARRPGHWCAEMRIPFASAGVSDPAGRAIMANFFRFRPPAMTGWHLPGFGGYVPMPFGSMVLLPRGRESQRTLEATPAVQNPAPVPQTGSAEAKGRIDWYPLSRCAAADVSVRRSVAGTVATLRAADLRDERPLSVPDGRTRLILDLPTHMALPQQAELEVRAPDGTLLHIAVRTLSPVDVPAWQGTTAGMDYLKGRIPSPWKKPTVSGQRVRLYDKGLAFAPNGLFASVTDDLGELLAGPGEMVLGIRGQAVTLGSADVKVTEQDTTARVEARQAAGRATIETRVLVDYDGFTVVKLRVRGIEPMAVDRLSVRLPLRKENARFVHRELVQEIRGMTGLGYEGPAGPVWLGGHDRGLSFSFDTDVFLSTRRHCQVQVVEEAERTWLQVNFVDGAGQFRDADHIFRFFLQPTPTKRLSLRKQSSFYDFVWEQWSDYQGYPDPTKAGTLKKAADAAHAKGRLFGIYTCQLLPETTPSWAALKNDLLATPPQVMYRRAYDPGKDVPCYLCCKRGPEGDLQLDGLARLIRDAGIDGIYSDGMSMAWSCDNPSHRGGCGRPTSIGWEAEDVTRVVGQRRFLKRLRGLFDERGKPFIMAAHCGGGLDINTLSFFDGYLEGEQLARYRPGFRLPLPTVAVGYCGRPWGFRTVFWEVFYSQVGGTRAAAVGWPLAFSLVHDVELNARTTEERRIFDGFEDDARVVFYPYWRPQPHIKRAGEGLLCSYYLRSDAAMVIVSNLTWDDRKSSMDLSGLFPGRALTVTDAVTNAHLPVAAGRLDVTVRSHRFTALRIEPRQGVSESRGGPPSDVPRRTEDVPTTSASTRIAADGWELNEGANGVTVDRGFVMAGGGRGLKLTSMIYRDAAVARLKQPLGCNATIRLRLQHSGRLRIGIGGTGIFFDSSWQPVAVDLWNEGRLFSPAVQPGEPRLLILSMRDGRLDALYGDQPLARALKLSGLRNRDVLELSVWGGDWLVFEGAEVSDQSTTLYKSSVLHPVR